MSEENYATWNVRLWMDNEEGLYRTYHDRAREIAQRYLTRRERIAALAEMIESDFFDAVAAVAVAASGWEGAITDILAHSEIDFERIAELFASEEFGEE